jgi:hypothetical protein
VRLANAFVREKAIRGTAGPITILGYATFDNQKLENLRAKYQAIAGNEIFDPRFQEVANSVFKGSDKRPPPYAGIPTLLRAPYRPDFAEAKPPDIDIALLGIPTDLGVTNRSGARFGPRAVRNLERVGTYEHFLRMAPAADLSFSSVIMSFYAATELFFNAVSWRLHDRPVGLPRENSALLTDRLHSFIAGCSNRLRRST